MSSSNAREVCDRGAPLCGQRFITARISPLWNGTIALAQAPRTASFAHARTVSIPAAALFATERLAIGSNPHATTLAETGPCWIFAGSSVGTARGASYAASLANPTGEAGACHKSTAVLTAIIPQSRRTAIWTPFGE